MTPNSPSADAGRPSPESSPPSTVKARVRLALGVVLLVGLAVAVEAWIGWAALLASWGRMPLPELMVAVFLVLSSYALRAARVFDYFRPATAGGYLACLRLTLVHNMLNNLLPMRSGEVSFPLLMRRRFGVPLTTATAGLVWFRLLDLHSLAGVGLLMLGWHLIDPALALLAAALWMTLPWAFLRLQGHGARLLAARLPARWSARVERFSQGLPSSLAAMVREWLWTLLNWAMKLGAYVWVLGVFVDAPAGALWLGTISGELTSVLPIHGVAGAGTYEAGVSAGMLAFGVDPLRVLQGAVNLHLFLLGLSILAGGVAMSLPSGKRP